MAQKFVSSAIIFALCFLAAEYTSSVFADDCRTSGQECLNGGVCSDPDDNSPAYCLCRGSNYGPRCENEIPYCLQYNSRCLNDGECVVTGSRGTDFCRCKQPYYGARCEYAVPKDEFCAVQGRCGANGHCIKAGDGFPAFCLCKRGYTGKSCESEISQS